MPTDPFDPFGDPGEPASRDIPHPAAATVESEQTEPEQTEPEQTEPEQTEPEPETTESDTTQPEATEPTVRGRNGRRGPDPRRRTNDATPAKTNSPGDDQPSIPPAGNGNSGVGTADGDKVLVVLRGGQVMVTSDPRLVVLDLDEVLDPDRDGVTAIVDALQALTHTAAHQGRADVTDQLMHEMRQRLGL